MLSPRWPDGCRTPVPLASGSMSLFRCCVPCLSALEVSELRHGAVKPDASVGRSAEVSELVSAVAAASV